MENVVWLHQGSLPRELVGGKGASLSGMMAAGFAVPAGFCLTAEAYRRFTAKAKLDEAIDRELAKADLSRPAILGEVSGRLQELILGSELPEELRAAVAEAYEGLCAMAGLACAVRSSAISEDGAAASFAGLYDSYLNVRGIGDVLQSVKRCYASQWSERALGYRARRGAAQDEPMAVVVMALVPSRTSGIAFTAHPVTSARDQVVINASWGLGEAIVSGRVTPDSFVVRKGDLALLEREVFSKDIAIYPHPDRGGTIERPLPPAEARAPCLSDDQAREVARLALRVEEHYGAPQDIEWGLTGSSVFLLQSRPITTL